MARGDSTSVSLPSGSGFSAGLGESFSVNLNTGQGVYSVPLAFPQGVRIAVDIDPYSFV